MIFGQVNAKITKFYDTQTLTRDEYGTPILGTGTAISHPVWFEQFLDEKRGVNGDTQRLTAKAIGSLNKNFREGDIIEITLDGEADFTKYRIEFKEIFSFFNNKKRMELSLIEEI